MVQIGYVVALIAGLTTIGFVWYEYQRTAELVTPLHLVWGFFGYFFLLSYLHLLVVGDAAYLHPFETPDATATVALLHVFGATLLVTGGYYLRLPTRLAELTSHQLPEIEINPQVGQVMGLGMYAAGILAAIVFIHLNGGLEALLNARDIYAFRTAENSLRYWIGLQVGIFGGLAVYVSGARFTESHGLPYLLCLATAGLFLAMHTRVRALFCLFILGFYAWYAHESLTPRRFVGLGVAAVITFALFRPIEVILQGGSVSTAVEYLRYYLLEEPGGLFVYTDYLQGYMSLVEGVPERVPHQWGRTFVGVPWIPFDPFVQIRSLASNPDRLTEIAIYGFDRQGKATLATGFGILFLNFGLIGLFVVALALGVLFRWAYVVWTIERNSVMVGAFYAILLFYFYRMLTKSLLDYTLLLTLVGLRLAWEGARFLPHGRMQSGWEQSRIKRLIADIKPGQIYLNSLRRKAMIVLECTWHGSFTKECTDLLRAAWIDSTIKDLIR